MLENIKSRRSCRNYLDKAVKREDLQEIVECGLLAPSGMNTQGVELCVITNHDVLNKLSELAGREFFYQAPALIVVYGESENQFLPYDGSCAMSQMYLAAHELGLGCCWINQMKDFVKDPKFEVVMNQLGLMDKVIVGSLAVGYKASEPTPRMMKKICRVHYVE
ncbi:MAG: nitroreductase family protein [Traorella sp.]